MTQTITDYKISSIVEEFLKTKDFKKKNDVLILLMKLKESLEFNATIDWPLVYKELGDLYKDNNPFYISDKYTPDPIERGTLGKNDIFVYGSNYQGIAGGGAAREAVITYGAPENGLVVGHINNCYAIPTKDLKLGERSCDFDRLEKDINDYLEYATIHPELTFWTTKIGCGLSGYSIEEIAPLFANKVIPTNVILPVEFVNLAYLNTYFYSEVKNKFFKLKDGILTVISPDEPSINTISDNNIRIYLPKDCQICSNDDFSTALTYVLDKINQL